MKQENKPYGPMPTIPDENNVRNILGFIETVSSVPTATPKTFYQSIKIYINGATYRLYVYDFTNSTWRYTALT